MKNIKLISIFLSLALLLFSCQDDSNSIGDIVAPNNVSISAEVVGVDTENPYGDGSGFVNITASADNVISYKFDFGDGLSSVAPSGEIMHRYSVVGVNTFTVVVNAIGTGGVSSSTSMEVEVYSSFEDKEAEELLSGTLVGDSKTWYWAFDKPLHVGLGPVTDDYGNGEFAYEAWWNGIQPFDSEKSCMYDNEFVFTKTANGITFEQTVGPAFVPGAYAGVIGVDGDVCQGADVATTMFGVKNVSFAPSSSKAALEGSYNGNPYRGTSFTISDGGFLGWYVGESTYDIIAISENLLQVRIIQAGGGFAWYQLLTSSKPGSSFETQYTNLVWSDEFDANGAPDAANWGYDLGAGGWGNGELQTYTNSTDNVIVEDGLLKITAKADGSGGYTSARLKSEKLFEFTYGRVEVRAKLPAALGTWPAIWMLGANFDTVGWPESGEIDIMEQTGQDKTSVSGTLHYPGNSGGNGPTASTSVDDSTSAFHNYSVEWTPEFVKILVDDTVYQTVPNTLDLPFNKDFFLILNVAMGGTLGGTIEPAFTQDTMEIDYVRVYQ